VGTAIVGCAVGGASPDLVAGASGAHRRSMRSARGASSPPRVPYITQHAPRSARIQATLAGRYQLMPCISADAACTCATGSAAARSLLIRGGELREHRVVGLQLRVAGTILRTVAALRLTGRGPEPLDRHDDRQSQCGELADPPGDLAASRLVLDRTHPAVPDVAVPAAGDECRRGHDRDAE